jgi:hypothetical protein
MWLKASFACPEVFLNSSSKGCSFWLAKFRFCTVDVTWARRLNRLFCLSLIGVTNDVRQRFVDSEDHPPAFWPGNPSVCANFRSASLTRLSVSGLPSNFILRSKLPRLT